MSSRGGRDRSRRDYPSRYEDKGSVVAAGRGNSSSNSRSNNPPSRHIWVGNLSHNIIEEDLAHHFLKFGPLESVAFQPGRSYAFLNFEREEDAIEAIRALQDFPLAGNPLRIEFTKADKSSTTSRDEVYSRDERNSALRDERNSAVRDERNSALRDSPFSQREFRGRHRSPEPLYPDKSKMSDKNPEPSEVLWIGFPALMKVDESTLRKAFSPFGEIVKITTFPGRSYAFVRFRNLMSASRAQNTLKGKLFGNPRVHICFAKSETGSSSSGRSSFNAPHSPFYNSSGREGSSENLRQGRSFSGDHNISSQNFPPNWDSRDSHFYDFNKKGSSWEAGADTYEQRRVGEKGPPRGAPQEIYERISPSRERYDHPGDFPQRFPQKGAFFDNLQALPEDIHYMHEAKKLKTGSPPERDLPEYPFSELERQKGVFPGSLSEFPQYEPFDKRPNAGNFSHRQTFDHPPNSPMAHLDRHDGWKPYDSFPLGPVAPQSNFVEKKRFTPEPDDSSVTEWKWEGTIAKGGTPICRARCFPVGKVMDMALPEFLDCTARTGLDMLSKHYYQAVGVWVVFFVPGSDADIDFYNEFMHYLEEKQRAAVCKLDEKSTLFLVPPSDFSEKVLKVPGKLSISGVILRLENPGLDHGPIHNQGETKMSYSENVLYPKPSFAPASPSLSELGNPGISNLSVLGNKFAAAPSLPDSARSVVSMSGSLDERRHDYPPIQQQWYPTSGQNLSSHNLQNDGHHTIYPRAVPDINSIQHSGGISGIPFSGNSNSSHPEIRPSNPGSVPVGSLQPEQLAQLAASLLQQQRQSGTSLSAPALNDPRQTNRVDGSETSSRQYQKYAMENNLVSSEHSTSQFGQVMQMQRQQQMSNIPQSSQMIQMEPQRGVNGNQPLTDSSLPDDQEADPQKRLQATLQLAAVLLQQIQQGKGS
ncbi:PREDICTED: flowering time control protein FPA isoform X1 [Lupinus angustifolius]|uniref:flowering time control protein FPA isoform X1 n=1 Tax=Lupinus angustifolius TaxID=3871 RepID=UPI00092E6D13|nr:PREDICTED: flowering time control protein FPA isoform X1 [Lupinus angustifolius]XP_019461206.1 PREDICTED: flowering time control protein FPA isoform X1 [Lupinus angustifolius]